jgi:hypothetical protein
LYPCFLAGTGNLKPASEITVPGFHTVILCHCIQGICGGGQHILVKAARLRDDDACGGLKDDLTMQLLPAQFTVTMQLNNNVTMQLTMQLNDNVTMQLLPAQFTV